MSEANEPLNSAKLRQVLEAALMAADEPLSVNRLAALLRAEEGDAEQARQQVREALNQLAEGAADHGYELKQVATGYRFQIRQELSPWVSRLWEEKPPRYSRALLETLALIVYKQPVTRADIEHIRGVGVSQSIMRTLLERGWIRVLGQREVPGRPNLYGSTRAFLDYFNLKSLNELPSLEEIEKLIEPLADDDADGMAVETADEAAEPLTAAAGGEQRRDSPVETADEVAEPLADSEDAGPADAEEAETPAAGEGDADASMGDPDLANVVRLPTAKR